MTRHGKVEPSAESPADGNDLRAPMVTVAADRLTTGNVRRRLNRAEAQRCLLSAPLPALPSGGHAIAEIHHKSKSP
ncbi:hypothetical protein [Tianweitania sediminis]|uniref:Uncharacterized protein n=1 Tax=Tianweitania sediminis TaxID=1502156 RepID=A0A8J7R3L8_9HYPH|nr:hypothetical protein [Tianweitania sediminis]MBP0441290.1 hypothetical protein [Tianweitania sediminis]